MPRPPSAARPLLACLLGLAAVLPARAAPKAEDCLPLKGLDESLADELGCYYADDAAKAAAEPGLLVYLRGWKPSTSLSGCDPGCQMIPQTKGDPELLDSAREALVDYKLGEAAQAAGLVLVITGSSELPFQARHLKALEKKLGLKFKKAIIASHSGSGFTPSGLARTLTGDAFPEKGLVKRLLLLDNFYFDSGVAGRIKEVMGQGAACAGFYTDQRDKDTDPPAYQSYVENVLLKGDLKGCSLENHDDYGHNPGVINCLSYYLTQGTCPAKGSKAVAKGKGDAGKPAPVSKVAPDAEAVAARRLAKYKDAFGAKSEEQLKAGIAAKGGDPGQVTGGKVEEVGSGPGKKLVYTALVGGERKSFDEAGVPLPDPATLTSDEAAAAAGTKAAEGVKEALLSGSGAKAVLAAAVPAVTGVGVPPAPKLAENFALARSMSYAGPASAGFQTQGAGCGGGDDSGKVYGEKLQLVARRQAAARSAEGARFAEAQTAAYAKIIADFNACAVFASDAEGKAGTPICAGKVSEATGRFDLDLGAGPPSSAMSDDAKRNHPVVQACLAAAKQAEGKRLTETLTKLP